MSNMFDFTFSYKLIYIFAINDGSHTGLLKIGDASIKDSPQKSYLTDNCEELNRAARDRIDSYTRTAGIQYELLYTTLAIDKHNKGFRDSAVHHVLDRSNIEKGRELNGAKEWYRVDLETAKKAIIAVKEGRTALGSNEISIRMTPIIFRPEQKIAIEDTLQQFTKNGEVKEGFGQMLWNAKMRFGKTLTALEVTKKINFKRTIIVTHRPVVKVGWYEDFNKIFFDKINFEYGSKKDGKTITELENNAANKDTHYVYFASIQDLRGSVLVGGKFNKNNDIFDIRWDFVIIDEAHEGTQTLLGDEMLQWLIQSTKNTKTLYLSGTPFNLLSGQKFQSNELYTWDYVMEQKAKNEWVGTHFGDSNPYDHLPRMNIFTYDLANILTNKSFQDIEDSAFNFKEFFRVWTGNPEYDRAREDQFVSVGKFVYERDVRSFIDLLVESGEHNYPFSTQEYRDNFRHTLWMVPGVKEARALSELLRSHKIFGSGGFKIVNVAGAGDEEEKYEEAYKKVLEAISSAPEKTRTITLSCGKLTTGVTVPAWTAVYMLAGSSSTSASSYLQTIFRVQNPANIDGKMKTECFVFDFAPDRTLKMVAEAGQLSTKPGSVNDSKKLMADFLNFCPVIGISGSEMKPYSTESMLVQLKRALIDKVARNGFDDKNLYNDNLLKLTDIELKKFQDLKKILKASKASKSADDIIINQEGLDAEIHETETDPKIKKRLTEEEKKLQEERRKALKEKSAAISILRGIAIRIPLLVYGADIDINQKIGVDNFTSIIDDKSWVEFMPKDISKEIFDDFAQYFDNEVFIEAGFKIRRQAKAADELPVLERVEAIANIFSTFKNPDKETVLTPWRVVNLHLGKCIGGYVFYEDDEFERPIIIDDVTSVRLIDYPGITNKIFNKDSKILDINSKTGLYPLFMAFSIYESIVNKGYRKNASDLWNEILKNNIYAVCRTKMAAAITKRTLRGFKKDEVKTLVFESMVEEMKHPISSNKYHSFVENTIIQKINQSHNWGIKGGKQKMKFNAIVGNPPYQDMGGSGGSNDAPIFQYFSLLANDINPEFQSLIIPSRWFAAGRENLLGDFRQQMLNNKRLNKMIVYPKSAEVFNNVEIKGGICFYLISNTPKEYCEYHYIRGEKRIVVNRKLNSFDILIREPEIENIVVKVKEFHQSNPVDSVDSIISTDTPFGISSNPRDSKKTPFTVYEAASTVHNTKLYHIENAKRKIEYIDRDTISKNKQDIERCKVFIPGGYGAGDDFPHKILGDPEVAGPNSVCSQSYLYVPFNNEEEANHFSKYLKTQFFRVLVLAIKITQSAPNRVYRFVPLQDFTSKSDINWNKSISEIDTQLYNKYKIDEEQRRFIDSTIIKIK